MRILKLFTNDMVLFSLNMIVLVFIYIFFINLNFNIFIEILLIAVAYYVISLITITIVLSLIYYMIRSTFDHNDKNSILKKLTIISSIFSEHCDDIHNKKDFKQKLQKLNR